MTRTFRTSLCTALLLAGLAGAGAQGRGPSFDCAKADGTVETLICRDRQLGELDRETTRLFSLARDGAGMTESRRAELIARERGWIKGRNDCWKADDPRGCVVASYAQRIHELRQGYADARSSDGRGISLGPFVATCIGMNTPVAVTFMNSEPALVYLQWRDNSVVLTQTLSGSGARYAAKAGNGEYVFWNKGDGADFVLPDKTSHQCRIARSGS
jgi:uncharacterized protein